MQQQRVYRPDQVAKMLQVSKRTVYRLVSSGEIGAFLVRSQLRITAEAVDEYIRWQTERYDRGLE
ncbi:helix-turn-helix domain-containing protein [uncultured Desulfobacter sp.]|uniref:helix-turn-helix domain-containing protein n=1 Tax=uncultured Desulfobacter sp. TaxID=240139 RepID=UPI003748EE66